MMFYFCQAVDALRNSPIIAQLVVEKGTVEDILTNSSGPPTPQESRYGAVQYSHYHASSDSYNGKKNIYPNWRINISPLQSLTMHTLVVNVLVLEMPNSSGAKNACYAA